ncbi:hypothetical protein ACT453_48075, partial [Bacillus sp. D-CC]
SATAVIIKVFDHNGCGGTHPKRTGEVGPMQVLSWERNKGSIRLTFIAGWRTLKLMGQQQQIMKDVSKQLTGCSFSQYTIDNKCAAKRIIGPS